MAPATSGGLNSIHTYVQERAYRPFQSFRDSGKNALLLQSKIEVGAREMSRLSFALLIVAGLMLTAYFGAVAWRMSDDSHTDVTGQIMPRAK
jgi:hypothetical protein